MQNVFSKVGGYVIKDIAQTVLGGIKNLDTSEKVLVAKDNIRVKKNIVVAMKELFKFHNLSESQIEMLYFVRTFSVLVLKRKNLAESFVQIDKIKKPGRMEALNELIELGLINEDDSIYMNDVLKDVIDAEFNISCFKIGVIDKFMELEFKNEFEKGVKYVSKNSQIRSICSYLCERIITVFENCNLNDNYSWEYMVNIAISTSYKVIRNLNNELNDAGYKTFSGKVSKKYFFERYGITNAA